MKKKAKIRMNHYYQNHTTYCRECEKPIYNYQGHGQKYCPLCSDDIHLETVRLAMMAYRKRWKGLLPRTIGTGTLSGHANPDFNKEFKIVTNEYRRLGLKKKE